MTNGGDRLGMTKSWISPSKTAAGLPSIDPLKGSPHFEIET
jgi:hypothetical protein